MSNVLTHPWKKKGSSPVWGLRQHKIYYKGFRNYSSFTALKLSNYSQLLPICLRLLIKGCGSSPPSRGGHLKPHEAPAQRRALHTVASLRLSMKLSLRWKENSGDASFLPAGEGCWPEGLPIEGEARCLELLWESGDLCSPWVLLGVGELVGLSSSVYAQHTEAVKLDLLPAFAHPHTSSLRPSPLQPSFPSGPCSYISLSQVSCSALILS